MKLTTVAAITLLTFSIQPASPAAAAVCGDGVLQSGEACDDGNTANWDGCNDFCAPEVPIANLLDNHDFSDGLDLWNTWGKINGTSTVSATFAVVDGEAHVDILLNGNNVQMYQLPSTLNGNAPHVFMFRGRNQNADRVQVRLQKHGSPYTKYITTAHSIVDLTTAMDSYAIYFTTTPGLKTDARIMLSMGSFDTAGYDYFFDDVVFGELHVPCGNDIIESQHLEQCDDGNNVSGDGCSAACQNESSCGDGNLDSGEDCDLGTNNSDAPDADCRTDCTDQRCGDMIQDAGEDCDDGNTSDTDACRNDCTAASCGDGVIFAGVEQCDDGPLNSDVTPNACRTNCALADCGDNVIDSGEDCDDGNASNTDECVGDCEVAACGDGFLREGIEECDDGDSDNDNLCGNDCVINFCGDGDINNDELCDEGGANSDQPDAVCRPDCTPQACGDGILDTGEECDDGAFNSQSADATCRTNCETAGCGDAVVDSGESCDDGNENDGDGCSASCALESVCGDGVTEGLEECDDGNNLPADGCSPLCTIESVCGDGNVQSGEACDDGNTVNWDGCSSFCAPEVPITNLLENHDFDDGLNNWSTWGKTNDTNIVSATFSEIDQEAHVDILLDGDNVQMYQRPSTLNGNAPHVFRFRGRNQNADRVQVRLQQHGSPFTQYITTPHPIVDLTTTMDSHAVYFTTTPGLKTDARIMLSMGSFDTAGYDYYFDDVVFGELHVPCGNDIVEPQHLEQCDDGNNISGDGCSAACQSETLCGNGIIDSGEECDDGNATETDACRNDCTHATCGDGVVFVGVEDCDDGGSNSDSAPDACRTDCSPASCGDGVHDTGEQCDDGNDVDSDGCRNNCTSPTCGDGILDPGEQCDDGNDVDSDGCRNNCTSPTCGDGILDAGEQCDDGNDVDSDGCRNNCTSPTCGDGILDPGEQCDDGNDVDSDGCRNNCTSPTCGDGILDTGEDCDDGNDDDSDGCRNDCTSPTCGDGILDSGEDCDDGNDEDSDGCRNDCTSPTCGDGILDTGEDCDDGNDVDSDGCRNDCTLPTCGDGILDAGEQCDDGNAVDTDVCDNSCSLNCGDGLMEGSEQCDDGNDADGDGCASDCNIEPIQFDASSDPPVLPSTWINVSDHLNGCNTPSSDNDCTEEIQSALDLLGGFGLPAGAAAHQGPNVVFFPDGVYPVHRTLHIEGKHGVRLIGESRDGVVIKWENPDRGTSMEDVRVILHMEGTRDTTFRNLIWDGGCPDLADPSDPPNVSWPTCWVVAVDESYCGRLDPSDGLVNYYSGWCAKAPDTVDATGLLDASHEDCDTENPASNCETPDDRAIGWLESITTGDSGRSGVADAGAGHIDSTFRNAYIGLRVGSYDVQNSEITIRRSVFENNFFGIALEDQNALNEWIWDSQFIANAVGITTDPDFVLNRYLTPKYQPGFCQDDPEVSCFLTGPVPLPACDGTEPACKGMDSPGSCSENDCRELIVDPEDLDLDEPARRVPGTYAEEGLINGKGTTGLPSPDSSCDCVYDQDPTNTTPDVRRRKYGGDFHVQRGWFEGNQIGDLLMRSTGHYTIRDSISIGSNMFVWGGTQGRSGNPIPITLIGNKIYDLTGDWAVFIESMGPILMKDNQFDQDAAPGTPYVPVRLSGFSEGPPIGLVAVGNRFSVEQSATERYTQPTDFSSTLWDGAETRYVSDSAAGVDDPPSRPDLNEIGGSMTSGGRQYLESRMVYEVNPTMSAAVIQSVIDSAILAAAEPQKQSAVLFTGGARGSGSPYSLDTTLFVHDPEDLIMMGDGAWVQLNWDDPNSPGILVTGSSDGFVLREIQLRGAGVVIEEPASEVIVNRMRSKGATIANVFLNEPTSAAKFIDNMVFGDGNATAASTNTAYLIKAGPTTPVTVGAWSNIANVNRTNFHVISQGAPVEVLLSSVYSEKSHRYLEVDGGGAGGHIVIHGAKMAARITPDYATELATACTPTCTSGDTACVDACTVAEASASVLVNNFAGEVAVTESSMHIIADPFPLDEQQRNAVMRVTPGSTSKPDVRFIASVLRVETGFCPAAGQPCSGTFSAPGVEPFSCSGNDGLCDSNLCPAGIDLCCSSGWRIAEACSTDAECDADGDCIGNTCVGGWNAGATCEKKLDCDDQCVVTDYHCDPSDGCDFSEQAWSPTDVGSYLRLAARNNLPGTSASTPPLADQNESGAIAHPSTPGNLAPGPQVLGALLQTLGHHDSHTVPGPLTDHGGPGSILIDKVIILSDPGDSNTYGLIVAGAPICNVAADCLGGQSCDKADTPPGLPGLCKD